MTLALLYQYRYVLHVLLKQQYKSDETFMK